MKKNKRLLVLICALLSMTVIAGSLAGCNLFEKDEQEDTTTTPEVPTTYVLQYTDDNGTHTIDVTEGQPYSITSIPSKEGYNFLGLFDAQSGGTQFISSTGSSVSVFTDKKNMILFPQFAPKTYTLVLNYGQAKVTGEREYKVAYDSKIPDLPTNLTLTDKEFMGWYTAPDRGGTQVADSTGTIPIVNVVNVRNFDLGNDGIIYLYAGFRGEMHTVTLNFAENIPSEEIEIEHGTPVSKIVTETRVDDQSPITWSKTQGGDVYNGKIISDTVLYAVEFAPVLDFDSDGGEDIESIVARAGSKINLPTPTKDMAKFSHWKDSLGNKFSASVMPTESLSLKAVWQPIIKFDTNGGTSVEDISAPTGTKIELPTTEKDGYVFAGWYVDDTKYTTTAMPEQSVKLRAGYYKIAKKVWNIVKADATAYMAYSNRPDGDCSKRIDLSGLPADSNVKVVGSVLLKSEYAKASSPKSATIDFYKNGIISDSNLLSRHKFTVTSSEYQRFEFTAEWRNITSEASAVYYDNSGNPGWSSNYGKLSDFYIEISYPDTSKLY